LLMSFESAAKKLISLLSSGGGVLAKVLVLGRRRVNLDVEGDLKSEWRSKCNIGLKVKKEKLS
jgi:hypothetical protein